MQDQYIELFKIMKPWLFYNEINKQKFNDEDIKKMRGIRINVNRIVAYNYEFPIKMSIETFLKIQSQKIFSIINCPNSMYTWRLFQRYVREMILQSWSLMINKVDEGFYFTKCFNKMGKISDISYPGLYKEDVELYIEELKQNFCDLLTLLDNYLPFRIPYVIPSFMHIINLVATNYENTILKSFKNISNAYLSFNEIGFISCQIGFKPFALLTQSGARITNNNYKQLNYIKDLELSYLKRTKKKLSLLSITEQMDDIFNRIFQKINQILGEKTFLKFFMRRMLCGCEFGICFNFQFNNESINDPLCFVDKDPLILFTISVKSMVPILAGVLVICLTYLSFLAKDIAEWIIGFPGKLTNEILKRGIFIFCNALSKELNLINFALDKAISFLEKTLDKQLEKLMEINSTVSKIAINIIGNLKAIFDSSLGDKLNEKFSSFLGDKIKNIFDWESLTKKYLKISIDFDIKRVVRISLLLLLCLGTFIMFFISGKDAIEHTKKTAKEYDDDIYNKGKEKKDDNTVNEKIDDMKKKNNVYTYQFKMERGRLSEKEEEMTNQINNKFEENSNSYVYQFKKFDPLSKLVKLTQFYDNNEEVIEDAYNLATDIKYCLKKKGKLTERCAKFEYSGFKNVFMQQIRIYATNKCPSILGLIGYSIRKKKECLFVEDKGNGTLADLINNPEHKKIRFIKKIQIAYGIAFGMKSLHKNNIIHRNLKPSNIFLDKDLKPFISDFCYAVQTDLTLPYILTETTPEFMAPEFILDWRKNQLSFKLDVYAYGIILFMLMTEKNPFAGISPSDILLNTQLGKRPQFTVSVDNFWKDLIIKCWNRNPLQRPSFEEICEQIKNYKISDINDYNEFKKYRKLF